MATKQQRVAVIVLDGVGVGGAPDAADYGDSGAATLPHILAALPNLHLTNLASLGLYQIMELSPPFAVAVQGAYGSMVELSAGKDTTTGHWEMAGLLLDEPFPVYPQGFPIEIITEFEKQIGRKIIGNCPASGTAIIEELGGEHLQTGYPIVYTSADSVFQIAAHEEVIPVEQLYQYCQIARKILHGPHGVGRVIARPFLGSPGSFYRTERRRDFSLAPNGLTILDRVKAAGLPVHGVGKIEDIFAGRGLTSAVHTKDNTTGLAETLKWFRKAAAGLLFVNLVDFDMHYGHRNDVTGFGQALAEVDRYLPQLFESMQPNDLLIITADHGCDPTFPGTDHTREKVPLLVYTPRLIRPVNLGVRQGFWDVAATVAEWLGVGPWHLGKSFIPEVEEALR